VTHVPTRVPQRHYADDETPRAPYLATHGLYRLVWASWSFTAFPLGRCGASHHTLPASTTLGAAKAFVDALPIPALARTPATTPCRWCGVPTRSLGTQMCDAHWELQRRIEGEPDMARRMLESLTEGTSS
jgi:hypothetical protein